LPSPNRTVYPCIAAADPKISRIRPARTGLEACAHTFGAANPSIDIPDRVLVDVDSALLGVGGKKVELLTQLQTMSKNDVERLAKG